MSKTVIESPEYLSRFKMIMQKSLIRNVSMFAIKSGLQEFGLLVAKFKFTNIIYDDSLKNICPPAG